MPFTAYKYTLYMHVVDPQVIFIQHCHKHAYIIIYTYIQCMYKLMAF